MDLRKALADLDAKHAAEREKLVKTAAVLDALPDYAREYNPRVFFHSLYGREATIYFEHDFYSYGKKDVKQPDLALLERLANDLPAVPLVRVKDGCMSFRTAAHVDAMPEDKKERWEEEIGVAPFLLKLSAFQHSTAEIEWVTVIAGLPVEISFKVPLTPNIGAVSVRYVEFRGGRRVNKCEASITESLRELRRTTADLDENIAGSDRIKWASGSQDVPNDFTYFWIAYREDVPPTVADLVNAIKAK